MSFLLTGSIFLIFVIVFLQHTIAKITSFIGFWVAIFDDFLPFRSYLKDGFDQKLFDFIENRDPIL